MRRIAKAHNASANAAASAVSEGAHSGRPARMEACNDKGQAHAKNQAARGIHLGSVVPCMALLCAMLRDVGGEIAQRRKYPLVIGIVGAKREAVLLGDSQCDFQEIDGVQSEPLAKQRGRGIDLLCVNIQIDDFNNQASELALELRLLGCHSCCDLHGVRWFR